MGDFLELRDQRTYKIIGAAIEVHKELGCGFHEAVYQAALEREFTSKEISFKSKPAIQIAYKGVPLKKSYQPDFICFDEVLVEIKALSSLSGTEEAQLINYLKATGFRVGLLLNFGMSSLEQKRYINDHNPSESVKSGKFVGQETEKSVKVKSVKSVDRFSDWEYPQIEEGKPTKFNWLVQHKDKFKLGYKTDIGAFTYINAKSGVVIEDFVQIGSHCSIYSISTIDNKQGQVVLKKNCRVGSHSVVMPGVTIGENSIVGAFSLVNQDVPDNVIAVGVPAKIIKKIHEQNS